MINVRFFPSRRLAWYMVKLFVTRSFAVLVALVLVLMMLDLLGESGKILAVPGNGDAELWRYVMLRVPMLVSHLPIPSLATSGDPSSSSPDDDVQSSPDDINLLHTVFRI